MKTIGQTDPDRAGIGTASSAPWPYAAITQAIIAAHSELDGPMLPILHALQQEFRCIPDQAIPMIAHALNLSRAEVHGVVSFYHDFRHAPAGRHVLKICRAEACQSMGGAAIATDFLRRVGLTWGGRTADGALTVSAVFCLGLCACAPAALFDDEPTGRLTGPMLDHLAEAARQS